MPTAPVEPAGPVDPVAPELMLRHADDVLGADLQALVIGPGLGQSERAETLLDAALANIYAFLKARPANPDPKSIPLLNDK